MWPFKKKKGSVASTDKMLRVRKLMVEAQKLKYETDNLIIKAEGLSDISILKSLSSVMNGKVFRMQQIHLKLLELNVEN